MVAPRGLPVGQAFTRFLLRASILAGPGDESSETWFYAYLMGRQRIAVYDGGWYEWSLGPIKNPVEVGEPSEGLTAKEPQSFDARLPLH